jgi:hypothetical protein
LQGVPPNIHGPLSKSQAQRYAALNACRHGRSRSEAGVDTRSAQLNSRWRDVDNVFCRGKEVGYVLEARAYRIWLFTVRAVPAVVHHVQTASEVRTATASPGCQGKHPAGGCVGGPKSICSLARRRRAEGYLLLQKERSASDVDTYISSDPTTQQTLLSPHQNSAPLPSQAPFLSQFSLKSVRSLSQTIAIH